MDTHLRKLVFATDTTHSVEFTRCSLLQPRISLCPCTIDAAAVTMSADGASDIKIKIFSWNVGNEMPDKEELAEWLPESSGDD